LENIYIILLIAASLIQYGVWLDKMIHNDIEDV